MSLEPAPYKLVVDGYNMLAGCSSVLAWGISVNAVDINVGRLADVIAGKSNRPVEFTDITVHMGMCDQNRHPARYAFETDRIRRWERDPRVRVRARANRYDEATGRYQEKGVDTALAMDLCTSQASGDYAGVVFFSADADHVPAVEHAYRAPGAGVQLARWKNQSSSLWLPGEKLWCHYLDEQDLARCSTRRGNRGAA
ncbi:NYN domain-containing protein [Rhodococcus spelaei]|uniref:NYN domain-containing protein n=1 Tax=Rhodococcus spelaei TaxID=2546320 RepID=A0A541AYZ2_9NOCA|nr:NYN domain-containing protein [Rhodococcus spelaei]TQF65293.1 NYN domain-containing protein [Rhodococcus spelaei]